MTIQKTISPGSEWPAYCYAPAITWVRDAGQILLVDTEKEQFWSIRGVEAAMWDFMTLAYPYKKIVRFLSLLLGTSTDEAEKTFLTVLRDWHRAGIIQVVEEDEHGKSSN